MSDILETEFIDLDYIKGGDSKKSKASSCKILLLSIADHCNDDGIAYPGLTRLELKTALSRQGVIDTIEALKQNGILQIIRKNEDFGTNTYRVNQSAFGKNKKLSDFVISQATLPVVVKPLDQQVVKPLDLNHHINHQLTTTENINSLKELNLHKTNSSQSINSIDNQPPIQQPAEFNNLINNSSLIENSTLINNHTIEERLYEKTLEYVACDEDGIIIEKPAKKSNKSWALAVALSEVTGLDIDVNKGQLLSFAKRMNKATPDYIRETYGQGGAWYSQHWKGQKNQRPSLKDIAETLFSFAEKNTITGDDWYNRQSNSAKRGIF